MSSAESAICPRDGSALVFCSLSGCGYWWCADCHGLLLEPEQLSQLRARALARLPPPWSQPRLRSADVLEATARCACPGTPVMAEVRNAELVVDVCRSCGRTWLDGGEIHQLLQPALFTATLTANGRVSSAPGSPADTALDALLELGSAVVEVLASAALDF
jgi:Zn-finger nucleic acid-binding protein